MSADLIRVKPAPALRRQFAAWAVAQQPKLRTVSSLEFGVPARLYTHMPERLLVGAVVDGHPYAPVIGEHDSEAMAALGTRDGREPTEGGLHPRGGGFVVRRLDASGKAGRKGKRARPSGRPGGGAGTAGVPGTAAGAAPSPVVEPSRNGSAPDAAQHQAAAQDGAPQAEDPAAEPDEQPTDADGTGAGPDAAPSGSPTLGPDSGPDQPQEPAEPTNTPALAGPDSSLVCPADDCEREFGSARALKAHTRRAHPVQPDEGGEG